MKNTDLLQELRRIEPGNWKKVLQNGWDGSKKVSYHYFQSPSGKIFNFKALTQWSTW